MRWLASNWFFILVFVGGMAVMHLGHGRHGGGHGGGHHRSAGAAAGPVGHGHHGPPASELVPRADAPASGTLQSSAIEDSSEKDRRSTPDDTEKRRNGCP